MTEASSAGFYADFGKLTELKGKSQHNSPEALRAAAQQFEAIFIQMMLKNMRDASLTDGDGLFDSDEGKMYYDMFDQQVSYEMGRKGQIGIADMLMRQLGPLMEQDAAAGETASVTSASAIKHYQGVANAAAPANAPVSFAGSQQEFIERLWPHAQKTASRIGVEPDVLIAQAALETGWGKSVAATTSGASSFNLFNIKASSDWQGASARSRTTEFERGAAVAQTAEFRAYGSIGESFDDYAELISESPRYEQAVSNAADRSAYLRSLQDAGYATDPSYAEKVEEILNRDSFQEAISRLKDVSV